MSTIAAISTPNAVGGISVIRMSGEEAFVIADKIFKSRAGFKPSEMAGYTCSYGEVISKDDLIDEAILTVFVAPRSYTGENVVEISCHGGLFVTRQVLRCLVENGAILAEAGEFTKRAFMNGKLSLTQAESVMDVISAKGNNELKYALSLREGALFERIRGISQSVISILGDLAAWADFPEEDIPEVQPENLMNAMVSIQQRIIATVETFDYGRIVRDGINTVICGRPNVGKSTIMNMLSGYERSIVTDIPGTTRDVIEESVRVGDYTLCLSDTAGIRNTTDVVEGMGVNIARKRLDNADLIFAVFDNSQELSEEDFDIINSVSGKNSIAIINKTDMENRLEVGEIKSRFNHCMEISAKNRHGIDELVEILNSLFKDGQPDFRDGIIANERQKACLDKALASINEAISALESGEFLDAVTVLLDSAADSLLELSGEKATENVVDEVFSRFCVGK